MVQTLKKIGRTLVGEFTYGIKRGETLGVGFTYELNDGKSMTQNLRMESKERNFLVDKLHMKLNGYFFRRNSIMRLKERLLVRSLSMG